jgi:aryl-alcohol dehydrogenase-like predicted oxidoreductase
MRIELTGTLPPLGRPVCRLVLGTTDPAIGDQSYADRLFDAFRRLGGNCLDTALNYLDSEISIGRWMRANRNRAEIVVLTKGAHHDRERQRVTPADIRDDLAASLERLQTDYVDLSVLHRDDPDQPVGPIMECLAEEQRSGRIRAAGASNWTTPRLEEAAEYTESRGLPGFALSSPSFSLPYPNQPVWPNCVTARDREGRRWYARTKMPLFAWSPLGSGFMSGRLPPRSRMTSEERARSLDDPSEVERVYYSERNFERLARAEALARRIGVSTVQIGLAWVLQQPLNIFAIVGPRSVAELEEVFAVTRVQLAPDEMQWLDLESDAAPSP